ncbi:MAG: DUF5677 domain-containing protein [Candidatus Pacebacteria bacterium]|nr:DUF5677 domain-containing protein [Candidatus Paceibacterota bacterium]MCF7857513.1 DUF5677 domain-containing protein [Candidatus Paceibacterota bacterium]
MPEEIKTLLSFNDRLHKIAETQLQSEIHDTSNRALFQAFVLGKGFKTYEAVLLLCRSGYGEDAFVLTRSLFELMVTNAYVLDDATEDTLLRYMNYDWVTRKEMYDYIASVPDLLAQLNAEIASGKRINTIPEVEAEYQRVKAKYSYRNGWSDKSIKGMSEAVGRTDMYSTVYRMQCTVGHTDARSMNDYVHLTDEGTILNIGPNWDLTRSTLVVTFDCFFHILKEAAAQLSWDLDVTLEALATEYAQVVGELKHGTD